MNAVWLAKFVAFLDLYLPSRRVEFPDGLAAVFTRTHYGECHAAIKTGNTNTPVYRHAESFYKSVKKNGRLMRWVWQSIPLGG
jgi:hypothetical protein